MAGPRGFCPCQKTLAELPSYFNFLQTNLRIFRFLLTNCFVLAQASTGKQGVLGPTKIYLAVQPAVKPPEPNSTPTNVIQSPIKSQQQQPVSQPPPLTPVQQQQQQSIQSRQPQTYVNKTKTTTVINPPQQVF